MSLTLLLFPCANSASVGAEPLPLGVLRRRERDLTAFARIRFGHGSQSSTICIRCTINYMAEKPTTVRLAPEINKAVRQFAADMGITFNAALSVLIAEALESRGRRKS